MIESSKLSKKFGKFKALNELSFQLNKGESIALIGPNGSGKTTLIKCILGLVKPDSGMLTVNNKSIYKSNRYREQIGYMPQINRFPDHIKVKTLFNMMLQLRKYEAENCDRELYEQFNIAEFENKKLGTLSGGMRQKVSASLAFMFHPQIIILDEPTAGLDPVSNLIFKEKVKAEKEKGKLILITSHILSDLEDTCSHVMYLLNGELKFYKSVEDLKKSSGEDSLARSVVKLIDKKDFSNY